MTLNLDFKVTPLFHSKHLRNGTRYRPSYCHVIILKCVISRVVTVFETKTKTAFFSQNRRELKPRLFWCQMNVFLRLDNRQDLKLRPNWDRCNNNDERACLSAPFITSLVSQSRGLQYTKRHYCLNVQ